MVYKTYDGIRNTTQSITKQDTVPSIEDLLKRIEVADGILSS